MIYILLIGLVKTFMFLRIFASLSPIVNMLRNVVYDLRIFLTFYVILVVLFSLLIGIIGVGNPKHPGKYQDIYNAAMESFEESNDENDLTDVPGIEYKHIGQFMGNLMVTLRMSMGDFGFEEATMLHKYENWIYWVIWFIIVIITCIIFLNFIIAEASASYEKVAAQLEPTILSEKASLICEADDMTVERYKNS